MQACYEKKKTTNAKKYRKWMQTILSLTICSISAKSAEGLPVSIDLRDRADVWKVPVDNILWWNASNYTYIQYILDKNMLIEKNQHIAPCRTLNHQATIIKKKLHLIDQ